MPTNTAGNVAQLAMDFAILSERLQYAKNQRNHFRCTLAYSGGSEIDDPGVPPCYKEEMPQDEMCEQCQKRAELHARVLHLSELRTKAQRRFFRAARKTERTK